MHELTPATRLARGRLHGAHQYLGRVPLPHRRRGRGVRRPAGSLKGTLMTTLPLTAGTSRHRRRHSPARTVARRAAPDPAGRVDQARLVALHTMDLARHGRRGAPRDVPVDPRRPAPFPRWYRGFDPTNQSLAGLAIGSLTLGVLGVLAMSGEYGTGTIRSSLAAMPRRGVLLTRQGRPGRAWAPSSSARRSASSCSSRVRPCSRGARPRRRSVNRACSGRWPCREPSWRSSRLLGLGIGTVIRHTAGAIAVFAGCTLLALHPALLHLGEHRPFRPRAHLRQLRGGRRALW